MATGTKTGGRRKGSPNKVTVAVRQRIEKEGDPIGLLCRVAQGLPVAVPQQDGAKRDVYPDLNQIISAARWLGDKIVAPAKGRPVVLNLPTIETAADLTAAMAEIMTSTSSGLITPEEGQALTSLVEANRKAIETVDLERRIAAIEGAMGNDKRD